MHSTTDFNKERLSGYTYPPHVSSLRTQSFSSGDHKRDMMLLMMWPRHEPKALLGSYYS